MVLAILISVNYGVLCEVTAPQPQQSAELAGQPASPPSSAPLLTSLLHLSRRLLSTRFSIFVTDVKKKLSSIKLPFLKAVTCTRPSIGGICPPAAPTTGRYAPDAPHGAALGLYAPGPAMPRLCRASDAGR